MEESHWPDYLASEAYRTNEHSRVDGVFDYLLSAFVQDLSRGATTPGSIGTFGESEAIVRVLAAEHRHSRGLLGTAFRAKADRTPIGQRGSIVSSSLTRPQLTSQHLLPFAASLVNAMKKRGYAKLQVYCYRYNVAGHFHNGLVWLQDPMVKGSREARPSDRVAWL